MEWLNANSEAVMAIVTTIYAFFTILLWYTTRAQAKVTRQIFEASHRPYLIVKVQDPTETHVQGRLAFGIIVKNEGSIPAAITAWEVQGTLMNLDGHDQPVKQEHELVQMPAEQIPTPVRRTLAHHDLVMLDLRFIDSALPSPIVPFRLRGSIEYRGLRSWTDRTDFSAWHRAQGSWEAQEYMISADHL